MVIIVGDFILLFIIAFPLALGIARLQSYDRTRKVFRDSLKDDVKKALILNLFLTLIVIMRGVGIL